MRLFALPCLALALAVGLGAPATAQTNAPPKKAPAAKPAKKAAKPATSHDELNSEAKGLALAIDTTETIDANQLGIAARVLTGRASCEMNLNVDVAAIPDKPGFFHVRFKKSDYVMTPEETTTGAIKLRERRSGVIWLQIPTKSMLLDEREGHRLVDACMLAEQRAAVDAANAAAAAGATAQAQEPATAAKN